MIVVADTSVVLNLCCVRQAELLQKLFGDVVIPPEVATEFKRLVAEVPRFAALTLPAWIRQQPCAAVPPLLQAEELDPGEEAALALALEIHADAVLLDERHGYRVAQRLGLNPIGVMSILLRAKTAGLLPEVKPVLESLQLNAQFWISGELRREVLGLAGEVQ